jgi:hypothetical protein
MFQRGLVNTASTSGPGLLLHVIISGAPSVLLYLLMFLFCYHMLCWLIITFLYALGMVVMKCTSMTSHNFPPLGVQRPKGLMAI